MVGGSVGITTFIPANNRCKMCLTQSRPLIRLFHQIGGVPSGGLLRLRFYRIKYIMRFLASNIVIIRSIEWEVQAVERKQSFQPTDRNIAY